MMNEKKNWALNLTICVLLMAGLSPMAGAQVTVPNVFENGKVADADEVNENFKAVADGINAVSAGATGPAGPQGPQGPQGATGPAGVAAGLSCNTNQIIRNNGSEWVCVTDPFANSCDPNQIIQWNGSAWVCADGLSQLTRRTLLGSIGWGYDLQSGPTPSCCRPEAGYYDPQLCDPLFDPEQSYQVCDNDRGPVQRDCSPTVSTYYCAERIVSCDGAGCDAVPSCDADEAACTFTLSGAGVVTCDLQSECSVRADNGRVENAVICKAGATCSGRTGTSDSTLFMYCEAGSSCNGTASTGDALTVMVCADGSTCTGGPSTGGAIVRQACEAGATCTCTPGLLSSQCLTDTYTNYTWPQQ